MQLVRPPRPLRKGEGCGETPRTCCLGLAPLNRSHRRESALISAKPRMRGLTLAATRFMESLHESKIAQGVLEPAQDRSADSLVREFQISGSRGQGCPRSEGRFMGSFHDFKIAQRGHEPGAVRCPRFSVFCAGQPKGWTPNGRFTERVRLFCILTAMNKFCWFRFALPLP